MRLAVGVALLFASCTVDGSGDDDDAELFECVPEECSGSYLATYQQIGGDCEPLEPVLVQADSLLDFGQGCTEILPPRVSDDGCRAEAHFECTRPDGNIASIVLTHEQADGVCSLVTGAITLSLYTPELVFICSGAYRVRYERG